MSYISFFKFELTNAFYVNKILLSILLFSLPFIKSNAQQFEHIEQLIGFEGVAENNGAAIADYDNDGDLDIFLVAIATDEVGNEISRSKLMENNGNGTFTNVTNQAGITDLLFYEDIEGAFPNFDGLDGFKYGASWGDYDNDGDPDLFLTHQSKVHFFENNGDKTFSDVTESAGFTQYNGCPNTGATWFDYNNDGLLDIYISSWGFCDGNSFFSNNGDGTFTNASNIFAFDEETVWFSFVPYPFDFNDDGWMDLYVTNDLHRPNQLFLNQNGTNFIESAASYGINTKADDMGITFSDYDLDLDFDYFSTAIDLNFLMNNQNNTYVNNANQTPVDDSGWAWGCSFGDYDLDGDEDLFVANGYRPPYRNAEKNAYYKNFHAQGSSTFSQLDNGLGEFTISVEAIDFDFDNDGDLDLLVTNSDRPTYFYSNRLINFENIETHNYQWFKVSLEGTVSNRSAIGTVLTLETTEGTLIRDFSGVGFLSQSIKPVHFGLKPNADIISLTIEWPSGIVETFTDVNENSFIKVIEEQEVIIIDSGPDDLPQGCTDLNACNYDPDAVEDDGSCTYLASNPIAGPSNSSYFSKETYSYALQSDEVIQWHVEGGTIISDYSSATIEVQWMFENVGRITAQVENDNCSSEEVVKTVQIGFNGVEDHISIARIWNEALLFCIRNDFARPTVHARNLFHQSAAMYDVWAVFNNTKQYLLGNEVNGFTSELNDFPFEEQELENGLREAISYANYRLLMHRFQNAPHWSAIQSRLANLMNELGYDTAYANTDYSTGNAAALGNSIAELYINYGLTDGAREGSQYDNAHYEPVNPPLAPTLPGNPDIVDPNRWQSLSLDTFIDQAGNVIPGTTIDFLSPEWGNVYSFALTDADLIMYTREDGNYNVYHDPSDPPYLDETNSPSTEAYQWGFSLVSIWSSQLDPTDGVIWDISPRSIGNLPIQNLPTNYVNYPDIYNVTEGGVEDLGYSVNPVTGNAYEEQLVPRGDYTRVLAEFWADGPDSETPPGHWFTILNTVNDHPLLERKFEGQGNELNALEWDVKSYFTLGGAMHDVAISSWGIKGWYDYIRPVSAIRYMADQGQSSDPNLPNYHPFGIPLLEGYVELVEEGEPIAGQQNEHVGKIKVLAWRGHNYIGNTETDVAGVDWILAENWWPYQRPSFVTTPFAGYVSGHSTYSRAAAEVLTAITGDEYFPGGMGEFIARKNEFLVFEDGPSTDVVLQWAKYRDASDQCSLSRIWGGIHPPADDIPGRFIGEQVGLDAFSKAVTYFVPKEVEIEEVEVEMVLYPNPAPSTGGITVTKTTADMEFSMFNLQGQAINIQQEFLPASNETTISFNSLGPGIYFLLTNTGQEWKIVVQSY